MTTRHTWAILLMVIALIYPARGEEIRGRVVEAGSGAPVPFAAVSLLPTGDGVHADSLGHFRLTAPAGKVYLQVQSLGFRDHSLTWDPEKHLHHFLTVILEPLPIPLKEAVLVQAGQSPERTWLNATEDVLKSRNGVRLVKRGNFALEPVVRGQGDGRVNLMVDGMRVFSACVDKMDPVSAYVEVENLAEVSLARGNSDLTYGGGAGGSIDLVTEKATLDKPFALAAESGFESAAGLMRFRGVSNVAGKNRALRLSLSLKSAGDFAAGGGKTIPLSGFHKANAKIDFLQKLGAGNLRMAYIRDEAREVGYPSLLMDATRATANLLQIRYRLSRPGKTFGDLETQVYANTVDHWMDDYQRDVSTREVMPNMYMPMFGKTRTTGFDLRGSLATAGGMLNLSLQGHRMNALADMRMQSLDPTVSEAFLLNLGDIAETQGAAVLSYERFFSGRLVLRSNFRGEWRRSSLSDERGRRQMLGFWEDPEFEPENMALGGSLNLLWRWAPQWMGRTGLSASERIPTHVERFGYFLYNPHDGYFYTGNPGLKKERTLQFEVELQRSFSRGEWSLTAFGTRIQNYISGVWQSEEFKVWRNFSGADLVGVEVSGRFSPGKSLALSFQGDYLYGVNRAEKEPLPLIPPLSAAWGILFNQGRVATKLEQVLNARQTRVARLAAAEAASPAYTLVNFRQEARFSENWTLKWGVENLSDVFYRDHLSIGRLPGTGRNFYLGATISR
ncbi:MAG TPA: TonB-dependent receptor [Calditrichia bacterium]|nr:TonB-dependent receptor [Calditrichota bacterium]HQU70831.1 TonB-dependent receptor [Calditrichia bacterium]HQV32022.1 TonB-dependent receptor [Calditrichia bacterium]